MTRYDKLSNGFYIGQIITLYSSKYEIVKTINENKEIYNIKNLVDNRIIEDVPLGSYTKRGHLKRDTF
jgi:hypothetical protein